MARVATLQVIEEPVEEPIFVEWDQGGTLHHEVIEPGDPRWLIAYLWREKAADLKNAERDLATKRAQLTKLQRAKSAADEAERRAHPSRTFIESAFARWQERTGHPACKLTPYRFDEAVDRLAEGYGREHLLEAVEGLAASAWVDPKGVKHDDWKVAMKDGSQIERYANLCPRERRNEIRGTLFDVQAVAA